MNAPQELSLTCVSLPHGGEVSYLWDASSQTLFHGDRELEPTDAQWAAMRAELDRADVWAWKPRYEDPGVLDGETWSFAAAWDGRAVRVHGQNAYPPRFEAVRRALVELARVAPARAPGAPATKRVPPLGFRALEPLNPSLTIVRRFREGDRVTLHSDTGQAAKAGILAVKHDVLWTGRIEGALYAVLEAAPYDLDDLADTAQLVARVDDEDHLTELDAATVARLEPELRRLAREGRSTDELPFGIVAPVGSGAWLADGLAQFGVVPEIAVGAEVAGPGGALALERAERAGSRIVLHLTAPGGARGAFRVDERVEVGGRAFVVVSSEPRRHTLLAWPELTVMRAEDRKEVAGALVRALDGTRGMTVHAPGRLTEKQADALWKTMPRTAGS